MSLRRWLASLISSPASLPPPSRTTACLLIVIGEESGRLLQGWGQALLLFCWDSLAFRSAVWIVWSSSAKWHWASSWEEDGEDLDLLGETDKDDKEMGREGLGMDIGELMLNLFGGDDEGLMLSEEPRRERRLLLRSFSSTFSLGTLIQEIFSGILYCRTGWANCCAGKRGGGGRLGGDRDVMSSPICFFWACSSVLLPRQWDLFSFDCPLVVRLELQCAGLSPLNCSVLFSGLWFRLRREEFNSGLGVLSGWWTLIKRGLMKQSAPLDWQHSSSDGVRVWSRAQPGVGATESGRWPRGGGLSEAVVPNKKEKEPFLFLHNSVSQKPA